MGPWPEGDGYFNVFVELSEYRNHSIERKPFESCVANARKLGMGTPVNISASRVDKPRSSSVRMISAARIARACSTPLFTA